jgi:hypothetical protein
MPASLLNSLFAAKLISLRRDEFFGNNANFGKNFIAVLVNTSEVPGRLGFFQHGIIK